MVHDVSAETGQPAVRHQARSVHAAVALQADRARCRATLFDRVEQIPRLIASTVTLPDLSSGVAELVGIRAALAALAEETGRTFQDGARLLSPRQALGDGADVYVLTGLPQPPLPVALISIGPDQTLSRLLTSVLRSTPIRLTQLQVSEQAGGGRPSAAAVEQWLRQVRPGVIVLAYDGGTTDEWATALDGIRGVVEDVEAPALGLVVGPEAHQEQAAEAIGDQLELVGVDPSAHETASVTLALTTELRERYKEAVRQALTAHQLGSLPFVDLVEAIELSVAFTHRRTAQSTLLVHLDCGMLLMWAHDGQAATAFYAERDLGFGAAELSRIAPERIARWLPIQYPLESLTEWLLNRSLRPLAALETREDTLIASAVLREALADGVADLGLRPPADVQLIIASSWFAELPPALVALLLLDSVQPLPSQGLVTLALDDVDLFAAAGALATVHPGYAGAVLEQDALIPLAHCIVVRGEGAEGALAVRGELRIDGVGQRFSVPYGSLHLLQLPETGTIELSLELEPGFRAGAGEPGASVELSGESGLSWAKLGLLIDARGRPLQLPDATELRLARVASWLADLGWQVR
ncbi:hypothetical protein HRbin26_00970 [bacterium HR26]|nr:hypothetical protein HRbin26_00970 [bacterium HR26]